MKNRKILFIFFIFALILLGIISYKKLFYRSDVFDTNIAQKQIELSGHSEIFKDRDITISNALIEISEKLKIQIDSLEIQDNNATLYLTIEEEFPMDTYPNKYLVYDTTNGKNLIGKEISNIERGNVIRYSESITLTNFKNETTNLELEILDNKDINIVSFNIDLNERKIDVIKNKNIGFQKISEWELKNVLGLYADLLYNNDPIDKRQVINAAMVEIAIQLIESKSGYNNDNFSLEVVNKAIKEFSGQEVTKPITLENSLVYYDEERKSYDFYPGCGLSSPLCLEITDISFFDGIYTATFIYCCPSEGDYVDDKIEDLDRFVTTMKFKLNNEYEYAKYCLVNIDEITSQKVIGDNEVSNGTFKINY